MNTSFYEQGRERLYAEELKPIEAAVTAGRMTLKEALLKAFDAGKEDERAQIPDSER
ncbi:MAG TPA: hypothetical protein VGI10_06235 [Polyangiaceae bacterium]|jgi:phosphopantetheinyl transferase (holo-ACP synthase)